MLILIPTYQPSLILVDLVKTIADNLVSSETRFEIVVVDDGSTNQESKETFRSLKVMKNVSVLRHSYNLGKGAALKTGLAYAIESNALFMVTADADGQHCSDDIVKLFKHEKDQENLVLGVRTFSKDTPLRSRIGNMITRFVFRLIYRMDVGDTQTGLRKIPRSFFNDFIQISSNGYEYEFKALIKATRMQRVSKTPIKTIYEPGNPTSHFRPLFDSAKIYYVLFRHIILAACISILDFSLFTLGIYLGFKTFLVIACTRSIAIVFYFLLAKEFVFRTSGDIKVEFLKFFLLVFLNSLILTPFIEFASSSLGMHHSVAYIIGTFFLYIFNFVVQKLFVFKEARSKNGQN